MEEHSPREENAEEAQQVARSPGDRHRGPKDLTTPAGELEALPEDAAAELAEPESVAVSEMEELRVQFADLEEQLKETRDRYIRALADLDNARKRARQEIAEARTQGAAGVLRDALAVVDSFERALETARPVRKAPPEARATYDGMRLIYRQLLDLLSRRSVKPIAALGQPFDTSHHEAVAQLPVVEGQEEGVVAVEVEKGYLLGDRVLRPSKVAVTVAPPRAPGAAQQEPADTGSLSPLDREGGREAT